MSPLWHKKPPQKSFGEPALGYCPTLGAWQTLHPPEPDRMLYFLGSQAPGRASLGTVLPTLPAPILITVKIGVAKVFPLL